MVQSGEGPIVPRDDREDAKPVAPKWGGLSDNAVAQRTQSMLRLRGCSALREEPDPAASPEEDEYGEAHLSARWVQTQQDHTFEAQLREADIAVVALAAWKAAFGTTLQREGADMWESASRGLGALNELAQSHEGLRRSQADLIVEHDRLQERTNQLEERLRHRQQLLETCRRELRDWTIECRAVQAHRDELAQEVVTLHRSWSWRIGWALVTPLRLLRAGWRRLR